MNTSPTLVLIIIHIIICGFTIGAKIKNSVEGESCRYPAFYDSKSRTCGDPVAYCQINVGKRSVFKKGDKKCILPLGSECDGQINPRVSCPRNGYCGANKTCECEEFFVPNGSYECRRGMIHGSNCDPKKDIAPKICEESEGFTCQNGTCICQADRSWSKTTESCVANICEERGDDDQLFLDPVSQQCQLELGTERGYYLLRYLRDNLIQCPANSHLEEWEFSWETRIGPPAGRCICDPGYHQSPNRRVCHENKLLGGACNFINGDSCNQNLGLICVRGYCECKPGATWNIKDKICYSRQDCRNRDADSYFDRKATKCFKYIGRPCEDGQSSTCPTNASCNKSTQKCSCDSGFSPAFQGEGCIREKIYGEDCSSFGKRGRLTQGRCSASSKLTCLRNATSFTVCGCQRHEIWNKKDQVCNLREGQRCDLPRRYVMDCTKNSKCEDRHEIVGEAYCICNRNYTKDFRGRCIQIKDKF